MNNLALAFCAFLCGLIASCARGGDVGSSPAAGSHELTLVGQVLLPGGFARRGLEVHASVTSPDGESLDEWLLFDGEGRFSHAFRGALEHVTVYAGGFEVFRMDREALPESGGAAGMDAGVIDLRERLKRHVLTVRSEEGRATGDVRVAMWSGPPPVGPRGGRVELGSRQFPSSAVGEEQEWLVPVEAQGIHFLVELPADSRRGVEWRSGSQQLFGPFTSAELPTELLLD